MDVWLSGIDVRMRSSYGIPVLCLPLVVTLTSRRESVPAVLSTKPWDDLSEPCPLILTDTFPHRSGAACRRSTFSLGTPEGLLLASLPLTPKTAPS